MSTELLHRPIPHLPAVMSGVDTLVEHFFDPPLLIVPWDDVRQICTIIGDKDA
ncbi:hypothetical protein D3C72_1454700 [compost metagenome]